MMTDLVSELFGEAILNRNLNQTISCIQGKHLTSGNTSLLVGTFVREARMWRNELALPQIHPNFTYRGPLTLRRAITGFQP